MQAKFEATTSLDRAALKAYYRLFMRLKMKALTIGMPVLGLISLLGIAQSLAFGDRDVETFGFLLLISLICMIVVPLIFHIATVKTTKNGPIATAYSFSDEEFSAVTAKDRLISQYSVLCEIIETSGYFYLFINQSSAHILKKSGFTLGTPEDFRAFIEEKTGKKVKFIR